MSRRSRDAYSSSVYMQHKRLEAATGQMLPDMVVGLLSAEEVKEREVARKEDEAAGSEKNKGVYQF